KPPPCSTRSPTGATDRANARSAAPNAPPPFAGSAPAAAGRLGCAANGSGPSALPLTATPDPTGESAAGKSSPNGSSAPAVAAAGVDGADTLGAAADGCN